MNRLPLLRFLPALGLLLATACTAPRAIVSTGKVTPKGEFKVGGNMSFNVPQETLNRVGSTLKTAAQEAARKDTIQYSQLVDRLQIAALAYVLDPVQPASDLYLRYGVIDRLDVGYKYAFGSHVFDAMYQFLGPVGTPENPGGRVANATYASIGLQYATQRAKLPNLPFLDNISNLLRFQASRHDLIIPLVVSHSFGPEEEIGAFSYGVVYSHTFLRYGFRPDRIYQGPGSGQVNQQVASLLTQRQNFSSYGAFANVKIGYRYVYFIPAVSIFYQNYGTYQLLNNRSATLKGVTVVPSVGIQFRIPTARR
ncbi:MULTISPECIES: hypothetical protein [Hymenobacter]|uniref:Outer membrane protein beta-barrel domain-containing protein n=1 Tax=Hymenobacter jejuensis TaxID=2502781 RepID=A0A5B7ZXY2_9BACT|nr:MULTISPECIES: hypothetical protein [Hymenobacter]MBC6988266.1 hypothetical protein [Hymenobacter sp. BT491]QDA59373.1 hypothetical protein FHG12_04305 [Hymenobacter jejuensis]